MMRLAGNEAAQLTELAKNAPGGLLAAGSTVLAATEPEAARWRLGDAITLRGRSNPIRLASVASYAPREVVASSVLPPSTTRIAPIEQGQAPSTAS
jgi:class 3 adenylate cyclase